MRAALIALLTAAFLGPIATGPAEANAIRKACIKSDRPASRQLCSCIQNVADITLSRSDQQRGAKYFDDPHALQEVRQSDRPSNERFWERWKAFGAAAASYCAT